MNGYVEKKVEELSTGEEKTIFVVKKVLPKKKIGYAILKRAFDIVFSFVCGIVLLPVMFVLGLLVYFDSPGGVIYKQKRLGKDGKEFDLLKFRTMRANAEENGPSWADKDDDRCTKIGAKIRKYRLDELPQLYNIFMGQMSLVGPRPERAFFYDKFKDHIEGFEYRLSVKPGLTGLAQVSGGYDLLPEEKIVYDMEYIEKRSVWLDIKIIFKTVKLVFTHEGAR